MSMTYSIQGPFKMPRKNGNAILDTAKECQNAFWAEIDNQIPNLPEGGGCYIFAIRAGKGFTPWYVGKTKVSFKKECFYSDKINKYNDIVSGRKGTPMLILITRMTNNDNISISNKSRDSEFKILESMLIGVLLKKNPKLTNIKGTKHHEQFIVPGFINSPKGSYSKSEKAFSSLLK